MNNSQFSIETVRAVYQAACSANIDYIELGYRNSKQHFSTAEFGPWRFCDEVQLRQVTTGIEPGSTKISIMQDAHKAVREDILPKSKSVVDMVRVATYAKDIRKAIALANSALDRGYETTINIMAVSRVSSEQLETILKQIATETKVDVVYIVDSFGVLDSEILAVLIENFRKYLPDRKLGVHFHNNLQLAFANSIAALKFGVDFVDATLFGFGRAAGNCPIELLIGYLKNPGYDIQPILNVIEKQILNLQNGLTWGYQLPYMLTGLHNRHPRTAMSWFKDAGRSSIIEFYRGLKKES